MSMKEYRNPLWDRVGSDTGSNGTPTPGPLQSPLKAPACGPTPPNGEAAAKSTAMDVNCIKRQMEDDRDLVSRIKDMLEPSFPPQFAIPFQPSPTAAVTLTNSGQGGTWTTLQSITFDQGYDGYITGYLGQVFPSTAWADVQFKIVFNKTAVAKFDGNLILPQLMNSIQKYQRYIPQNCQILFQALNSGSSDVLAQGMLSGWTAPMRRL